LGSSHLGPTYQITISLLSLCRSRSAAFVRAASLSWPRSLVPQTPFQLRPFAGYPRVSNPRGSRYCTLHAMLPAYSDNALDAQTPILENMAPSMFTRQLDTIAEQPLLDPQTDFPIGKRRTSQLSRIVLTARQPRLHMRERMCPVTGGLKPSPTEGTKRSFRRIPWAHSEER
jgi:hypothetical protein